MVWLGVFGISVFTVLIAMLAVTFGEIPEAEASEPFIAEIKWFGGNFAPRGYAFCDGQLLPISQNSALFSILGTTYGGDGRTTFGLPDARDRVLVHAGSGAGPGLTDIRLGQKGGSQTVTLTVNNLPAHSHTATLNAVNAAGDTVFADGTALALSFARNYSATTPSTPMSSSSIVIGDTGGNQGFSPRDPYVAANCIIALVGTFPSRN